MLAIPHPAHCEHLAKFAKRASRADSFREDRTDAPDTREGLGRGVVEWETHFERGELRPAHITPLHAAAPATDTLPGADQARARDLARGVGRERGGVVRARERLVNDHGRLAREGDRSRRRRRLTTQQRRDTCRGREQTPK